MDWCGQPWDRGRLKNRAAKAFPLFNINENSVNFAYKFRHLGHERCILTLCGLTSQKTHRGGLGLGGLVHEEAHPCFPYFVQPPFKRIDTGSTNCPLVQLILYINYSVICTNALMHRFSIRPVNVIQIAFSESA